VVKRVEMKTRRRLGLAASSGINSALQKRRSAKEGGRDSRREKKKKRSSRKNERSKTDRGEGRESHASL